MKAILVLQDGTVFEGKSIGAAGRCTGEVVFNTSMTGYQEMVTDPSYRGQILTFTYPLIGNYGANSQDIESSRAQAEGVVVKQLCREPSNWQSEFGLEEFLKEQGVVGIEGVDTRALTRQLRTHGVMMGTISTEETPEQARERLRGAPDYGMIDFCKQVSTPSPYQWNASWEPGRGQAELQFGASCRVVVVDFGVKFNILRILAELGCETVVVSCDSTAKEILRFEPDGVVFSPGPGDPALLSYGIKTIEALMKREDLPLFGICIGHQLMGWALGSRTFKLKFGHRGANHPVKHLATGKVSITSQNHGYAVEEEGLKGSGAVPSHINLNDGTIEGLDHAGLPVFSLQYHPEASPGPRDERDLFGKFLRLVVRHASERQGKPLPN